MEKFKIKNRKGLEIVGSILIPKNPRGLSFVIHGLGGFKEQPHIKLLADTLFENDYIVVNFDVTNSIGESGGKYEDATMQNHYEDLVDVIGWAKKQDWYKEPFVLAGHSLGGFAVAKYAEEYSNEVEGVFPFAGVFSGLDNVESSKKNDSTEMKRWEKTGWKTKISSSKPGLEMRLPWSHIQERLKHDLKLEAHKITMPILFVMGEKDFPCPPVDEKKFFNLLPIETKKEFHVIKNAPHTFRDPGHLKQLRELFDNWLKNLK
ncbi:alpha/beta fold hydrolase [Patescibacteria group bacterium]|nr:alpha/beta fold hydrolase [Patescibacteria group bacterium]MBU1728303.1 alpha/beta fold hydrolase [Patescibacteria group bacterium]